MERKKISYKHFFRDSVGLVKFNFWPLAIFELFYCFLGTTVIFPAVGFVLKHALSVSGLFYITGFNLTHLVKHPLIWVAACFLILLLAFYALIEFTTLTACFHESFFKRKVQAIPLIRTGIRRAIEIIKPKNFLMILFLIFIIPFANILITSNFIKSLSLPGFIVSYISNSPPLATLFILLILFLFFLILRFIFVFHLFTLENQNFKIAWHNSFGLTKKRFFRIFIRFLLWNMLVASILALIAFGTYALFFTPTILGIQNIQNAPNNQFILTLLLGFLSVLYILLATLFNAVETPLHLAFITKLYYAYSDADGIPCTPEPLVKNTTPPFIKPRYLIFATCLILVFSIGFKSIQIMLVYDLLGANTVLTGPEITAHRGDSKNAPENTKAALEGAIAKGVAYVEIDIAETKDGVLVVSHDNNLKRLSGKNVDIWNSNYADIKNLDIGSFFSPNFSDQRIMTLDEAIEICKDKIKMNIELKPTEHDKHFVEKAVETIERQNFKNDAILASLSYPTIERVKEINPEIQTAYISAVAFGDIGKLSADIFSIEATFVTKSLVEEVHKQGKEVHVWTLNTEDLLSHMINLKVDNLITDDIPTAQLCVRTYKEDAQDLFKTKVEEIVLGI